MKKTLLYTPTSTATCVFLVLLRLAIGWHLFIEGAAKLETFSVGTTGTSKPFSSRGYLLQSQGPLSPVFRRMAGDPDELLITLIDSSNGAVPVALQAQWRDYVQRYIAHYQLDQDQQTKANTLLDQHLAALAEWFKDGSKEVGKDYSFASITVSLSTSERIAEYRSKLKELHDKVNSWNLRFEKDVTKARVSALKAEVARLRTELQKDLDDRQAKLEQELDKLLKTPQLIKEFQRLAAILQAKGTSKGYSKEHQGIALLVEAGRAGNTSGVPDPYWVSLEKNPIDFITALARNGDFRKNILQVGKSLVSPPLRVEDTQMLDMADHVVAWGLTIAGLGLLLGCFTRLSCLTGALLLLLFFLALPPLPGLPDNPMAEGKYLFVNKNLIEALALLALATTASGRWFGVDGLLSLLTPFKYLWPKPLLVQVVEPGQTTSAVGQPAPATPDSTLKE